MIFSYNLLSNNISINFIYAYQIYYCLTLIKLFTNNIMHYTYTLIVKYGRMQII